MTIVVDLVGLPPGRLSTAIGHVRNSAGWGDNIVCVEFASVIDADGFGDLTTTLSQHPDGMIVVLVCAPELTRWSVEPQRVATFAAWKRRILDLIDLHTRNAAHTAVVDVSDYLRGLPLKSEQLESASHRQGLKTVLAALHQVERPTINWLDAHHALALFLAEDPNDELTAALSPIISLGSGDLRQPHRIRLQAHYEAVVQARLRDEARASAAEVEALLARRRNDNLQEQIHSIQDDFEETLRELADLERQVRHRETNIDAPARPADANGQGEPNVPPEAQGTSQHIQRDAVLAGLHSDEALAQMIVGGAPAFGLAVRRREHLSARVSGRRIELYVKCRSERGAVSAGIFVNHKLRGRIHLHADLAWHEYSAMLGSVDLGDDVHVLVESDDADGPLIFARHIELRNADEAYDRVARQAASFPGTVFDGQPPFEPPNDVYGIGFGFWAGASLDISTVIPDENTIVLIALRNQLGIEQVSCRVEDSEHVQSIALAASGRVRLYGLRVNGRLGRTRISLQFSQEKQIGTSDPRVGSVYVEAIRPLSMQQIANDPFPWRVLFAGMDVASGLEGSLGPHGEVSGLWSTSSPMVLTAHLDASHAKLVLDLSKSAGDGYIELTLDGRIVASVAYKASARPQRVQLALEHVGLGDRLALTLSESTFERSGHASVSHMALEAIEPDHYREIQAASQAKDEPVLFVDRKLGVPGMPAPMLEWKAVAERDLRVAYLRVQAEGQPGTYILALQRNEQTIASETLDIETLSAGATLRLGEVGKGDALYGVLVPQTEAHGAPSAMWITLLSYDDVDEKEDRARLRDRLYRNVIVGDEHLGFEGPLLQFGVLLGFWCTDRLTLRSTRHAEAGVLRIQLKSRLSGQSITAHVKDRAITRAIEPSAQAQILEIPLGPVEANETIALHFDQTHALSSTDERQASVFVEAITLL